MTGPRKLKHKISAFTEYKELKKGGGGGSQIYVVSIKIKTTNIKDKF